MSEEKLYAVKNDEGEYCDFSDGSGFWPLNISACPTTTSKKRAERVANYDGHVVALVEEPEKEAVSESIGGAIDTLINADTYVQAAAAFKYLFASRKKKDLKRIMKAIRNGYTVAKEKKYLVFKELGGKQKNQQVAQAYRSFTFPNTITWSIEERKNMSTLSSGRLTESEIEHYGLQDCEKEEVTDDDD